MDLSTFVIAVFSPLWMTSSTIGNHRASLAVLRRSPVSKVPTIEAIRGFSGMETDKTVPHYARRHHGERFPARG